MSELEVVLEGGHFYEGARWHEGRLWVSDFFGHQVVSTDTRGDVRTEAKVPTQPSGLGWLPDGRLLIVSMLDQTILRREASGELTVVADGSTLTGGQQLNDMVVDRAGRAFVSSLGFNPHVGDPIATGPLLRVDPDGSISVAASDLHMPNGLTILAGPDGDVLVVAETLGNRLSAFDIGADGALSARRDWARFGAPRTTDDLMGAMGELSALPDGLASDAEGAVWFADALRGMAVRVAAGGEVLQEIPTGNGTFSVALGGDDGHTLFLCVAPDFSPGPRTEKAEAKVLATRVDVPARA